MTYALEMQAPRSGYKCPRTYVALAHSIPREKAGGGRRVTVLGLLVSGRPKGDDDRAHAHACKMQ